MRTNEAARAAGVSVKALRYYEQSGLLQPARGSNGYREYDEEDVRLAAEIRELLSFGIATREARPFLDCLKAGHEVSDACPESLAAYQQHIDRLDQLIGQLSTTRTKLAARLQSAARRGFTRPADKAMPALPPLPDVLPGNLPEPEDDGAALHLPGMSLPALTFRSTKGSDIQLDSVGTDRWVLYVYPLTGDPGVDMPRGWDEIPGARGCSQEACSFRDNAEALAAQGVEQVLALSSDRTQYQQELAARFQLTYPMLSDPDLSLADALDLPTFEANGTRLYKRLTLVLRKNTIEHVFYPVFPPASHAEEVVQWLRRDRS